MAGQAHGIRVYVVGVGTEGGGKIPVVDEQGGRRFLADQEGAEVVTRMDRASLRRLAQETGGDFLAVDEDPTPLETLYGSRVAAQGRELIGGKQRIATATNGPWPWRSPACWAKRGCASAGAPAEARHDRSPSAAPRAGANARGRHELPRDARGGHAGRRAPLRRRARARRRAGRGLRRGRAVARGPARGVPLRRRRRAGRRRRPRAGRAGFASARALAGPGELRVAATCNQGTAELLAAGRSACDPAGSGRGRAAARGRARTLAALRRAYLGRGRRSSSTAGGLRRPRHAREPRADPAPPA